MAQWSVSVEGDGDDKARLGVLGGGVPAALTGITDPHHGSLLVLPSQYYYLLTVQSLSVQLQRVQQLMKCIENKQLDNNCKQSDTKCIQHIPIQIVWTHV